jgi:hypothetical protein
MSTWKVELDPGSPDRQQTQRRRRGVGKTVGAFAVAAAIGLVACSGPGESPGGENATAPSAKPTAVTPNPRGVEVATAFAEAYGAFDIEQAFTYLADDADISGIGGTLEEVQLRASWFEAMGYKQILGACEVLGTSSSGTVRCPYDFHALRSEKIGLGPFSGSLFLLSVEDGAIVRVSNTLNYSEEFSPQMWEPFAKWVSKSYPKDAKVMYTDGSLTDGRLTEESFLLWEKHSREYAREVAQT